MPQKPGRKLQFNSELMQKHLAILVFALILLNLTVPCRGQKFVKNSLNPGDLNGLLNQARKSLSEKGFIVDYVEIANAADLRLTDNWDGQAQLICLVAAFLEEVRLIDNMIISPSASVTT